MRTERKETTRSSYVRGGKSWENFLLDGAPGTPFTVERTIPKSAVQIIPAVGMRIVTDFEKEEFEIVRFVELVRLRDILSTSKRVIADSLSLKYP